MSTVNLIEVQRRSTTARPGQAKAFLVLRIAAGFAACPALLGCVTDAGLPGDLPAFGSSSGVTPDGMGLAAAKGSDEPMHDNASAMVAKARALAFADPVANRPQPQIDLAMLAMRSNPGATHRIDGSSRPEANASALSPEAILDQLRRLSHDPGPERPEADDRTEAIRARLQELSHHSASDVRTEPQALAALPGSSARAPVSPEAIMRRMQELTARENRKAAEPPSSAHDVFGGISGFVPAPEMARPPAVDRVSAKPTEAAQ